MNKEIDDEYLRLAIGQRRPAEILKENRLSKWLGIKYYTGTDTGRLHSSTAFVEFKSLAAKEYAVQCNILGTSRCMEVIPVPEVRDLIWENMVSQCFEFCDMLRYILQLLVSMTLCPAACFSCFD